MANAESSGFKIAIIGATGAVGRELLKILDERKFPIKELVAFASPRSVGKVVKFKDQSLRCKALTKGCFAGIDFAFFDASDAISKDWVPEAASSGAWVIDNSATYRMEQDIPLLVPEVNGHLLDARIQTIKQGKTLEPRERILAGPNCSTVQLVVALKPLSDQWGLKRVVVSSYQSVSGAGTAATEELSIQTMGLFNQKPAESRAFSHQIAFNCIPQIGGFKEDGNTSEEQKIILESRKILGLPNLRITATAVRVPTLSCHGESVNVECDRDVTPDQAREAMRAQAGLIVLDEPAKGIYPMGMTADGDAVPSATGKDPVYVGRIRKDHSVDHGLNFWVVSDNLRKGAALNAVQIGEALVKALF